MSRKGSDACRDFWSRRSFRLSAVGFFAVTAVVLVFGFGATPKALACSVDGPSDTVAPTFSSQISGLTRAVAQSATLKLTEGTWVDGGTCNPQISSVTYNFSQDDEVTSAAGPGAGGSWGSTASGGTALYSTVSGDAGHAITGSVTACDTLHLCTTVTADGLFAPYPTITPTGDKVGVNSPNPSTCSADTTLSLYDAQAHSQWARLTVWWSKYETGLNTYDSTYASLVSSCIQKLHTAGESVLVVFDRTPWWATQNTTLSPNAITAGQTTIHVASATGFPVNASYDILIDSEQMTVAAHAQGVTTWSVTRGVNGTTAAAHSNGAIVSLPTTAAPNNSTTCGANETCYAAAAQHLAAAMRTGGDGAPAACGAAGGPYATLCGVQAIEVWNEENGPNNFWTGTKPQYEKLLKSAYGPISGQTYTDAQNNPHNVQVVLGAPGGGIQESWTNDLLDTEKTTSDTSLYCANGPQNRYCFNVLGVHPYAKCNPQASCPQENIVAPTYPSIDTPDIPKILNDTNTANPDTLDQLAADLDAHCLGSVTASCPTPTSIPMWITEMGAIEGPGNWVGSDVEYAHMLSNFYKYVREQPVVTACAHGSSGCDLNTDTKTVTCPATTCDRVQVGMWYAEIATLYPGYQIFFLDPSDSTYQPKLAWAAMLDLPN